MYASDNVHDAAGDECVQVRYQKRQCAIFPLIRIPGDSIRLSSELNRAKSKKGVIPKKRHAQRGIFLSLSLLHRHVILLMQQYAALLSGSTRITHTTYNRPMCYVFMLDRFLLHISDYATTTFHFNTYVPCNDYIHTLVHVYYSVNSSIPVAFWG